MLSFAFDCSLYLNSTAACGESRALIGEHGA